jgi:DNA-binding MarR family transcriptional regulator/GNAT superfamily N-acetyltransferase
MDTVEQVRRFNRAVTRRIGALDEHFLGRRRSLGGSRLLFEIGPGSEIRALRGRLGLDSGYASRLLRGLEAEGLIRIGPAPEDARVGWVTLTPAGRREVAALDRLSDEAAATLLADLTEVQRRDLTDAMATVERLLRASSVRVEVADPSSPPAVECLTHYVEELADRFEAGFDPARSISAAAEELTPPRGYFVLALLDGEAVGCGALKCCGGHGEIKRMWVRPAARGLGVGRRVLRRLEELARQRRLPLLRLETNRSLTEARSLYVASGYHEVPAFNDEPYAHHWFEKRLASPGSRPTRRRRRETR